MKRFDITQWANFVRGLGSPADQKAMQAHLNSGCRSCRRTAAILRYVAKAAATDAQYEVPDYAVRCARAIFTLQQPEKVQILPRILARLVYDSFREPLPAGVRGQQRLSRQALYDAGDFRLDLRLEHSRGSPHVALIGQIENRKDPTRCVSSVPVLLASGKEIIARTISNEFGEFHLDYLPRTHLRLYIPVLHEAGRRIEVPLNGFSREKSDSKTATRRKFAARRTRRTSAKGVPSGHGIFEGK